MATGTLEVILLQGKDLKDVEKLGKQSPYCIFVCGDIRTRSQACKDGGRNPVWKEAFAFEITNQIELGILVMSEHRNSKDATIGASHIPLTEVEGKGWVDVTTPVTVNKSGKSQGVLMLQMRYRLNYTDQLSESGDSGRVLSPYRQRSARPAAATSPHTNNLSRVFSTDYRELSSSTSGALTRRRGGADQFDGVRSPEALLHRNHHDNVQELPSASSSNSGIHLEDSAASGLHPEYDPRYGESRYQSLTPVDPKLDNVLRSSDSKFSDTLSKSRTLERQASRGDMPSSMTSSFELESLKRQLTELTQQKAALEASLAAKEEESNTLRNKISTISSMSFKDRKNWIEEKEHLQLELLTLRQQLGEQTDSAVMKQQHGDMVRLRTRVTELEAELTQQKSLLEQRSRMTTEVMLKDQQESVQEAMQQVDELKQSVEEMFTSHSKLVADLEQHIDDTTAELASSLSELSREKAELQQLVQQVQEAAAVPRGVDQGEMDRAMMGLRETHAQELAELNDRYQELLDEKLELEKLAEEVAVMKKTHVFLPQDEHLDLLAFKSRCAHLEQSSEGKVLELSKLLQEAEQHLAAVEKDRDALQTGLNTTQIECQKLQEAAAEHKARVVELELQVAELETNLKQQSEDVSTKERELSELREHVDKAAQDRLEAHENISELKEVIAAKERDLGELAEKLEATLREKVETEACLTSREREFSQEYDKLEKALKEKAAIEVLLKELTASSAAKEAEINEKLDKALRERFEFEVEVAEMKEKLEEAKAQAEAGIASLQEQLKSSNGKLEEQTREISRQQDMAGAEQQRADKAEKLMQQAQEAADKAEKDAVKARDENAEAQVKIMVLDSEIKTMRDTLESTQRAKDELDRKLQETKHKDAEQLERLKDELEEQRAEISSMTRERDAATKSLKSLQEHVQGQASKAEEALMKELLEKNFELEMASEDLRHENDVLTQDLVATKLELARLREVETLFRREVYKAKVNGNRSMVA